MARSKELTPREKEFAKEFVRTGNAYKSALKVGYDETTAKNKSYKWVDKEWEGKKGFKPLLFQEVERLKSIVQTQAEEKFQVSIKQHYDKLREIQELAMLPDEKGNYKQLSTAAKCEESIGHLFGLYEKDNMQKAGTGVNITVASSDEAELIKEIQNVKAD